jgi:hypothetical protein
VTFHFEVAADKMTAKLSLAINKVLNYLWLHALAWSSTSCSPCPPALGLPGGDDVNMPLNCSLSCVSLLPRVLRPRSGWALHKQRMPGGYIWVSAGIEQAGAIYFLGSR